MHRLVQLSRRMLKKATFSSPNPGAARHAVPRAKPQQVSKPEAYPRRYVEDFNELRTMLGAKRVSARGGWAGEKKRLFQHPVSAHGSSSATSVLWPC